MSLGTIRAALTRMHSTTTERASHGGLHISDVANGCTRAVWHRLHRGAGRKFDSIARRKMRYGLLWEDECRRAVVAAGELVLPPTVTILRHNGTIDVVSADAFDAEPQAYATPADLVGHPDLVLVRGSVPVLYEIKTTSLRANGKWAPRHRTLSELRSHCGNYILQGAAYAHAVGAPTFIVYVSDRGRGIDMEYTFDTAAEWPAFEKRWNALRAALNPTVEPRGLLPPWTLTPANKSYLCAGCPALACQRNPRRIVPTDDAKAA